LGWFGNVSIKAHKLNHFLDTFGLLAAK